VKIVTIGPTPYLNYSIGQLHASVIRQVKKEGHQICSLVYGHDPTYYIPEKNAEGKDRFYYRFEGSVVQLYPVVNRPDSSTVLYEMLRRLAPDIVISVGDHREMVNLYAAILFLAERPKWIAILGNTSVPINPDDAEMFDAMDTVICTSRYCQDTIRPHFKGESFVEYVGPDPDLQFQPLPEYTPEKKSINIMVNGQNHQYDCIPSVMMATATAHKSVRELRLYVHSDAFNVGHHQLTAWKKKVEGVEEEFIDFPEYTTTLKEGAPASYYASKLRSTHLFVSVPMISATSMSLFDAMGAGCLPVVSEQGSHAEVVAELCHELEIPKEDILIKTTKFIATGDYELHVTDVDLLAEKLLLASLILEKRPKIKKEIATFSLKYKRSMFLRRLTESIGLTTKRKPTIRLEAQ
jgi:hypothetical protein